MLKDSNNTHARQYLPGTITFVYYCNKIEFAVQCRFLFFFYCADLSNIISINDSSCSTPDTNHPPIDSPPRTSFGAVSGVSLVMNLCKQMLFQ